MLTDDLGLIDDDHVVGIVDEFHLGARQLPAESLGHRRSVVQRLVAGDGDEDWDAASGWPIEFARHGPRLPQGEAEAGCSDDELLCNWPPRTFTQERTRCGHDEREGACGPRDRRPDARLKVMAASHFGC
jgi:hypothetical protein